MKGTSSHNLKKLKKQKRIASLNKIGFMLIERINSPKDIKNLKIEEIEKLSEEIREIIVDVVSKNGGHLSPSLGIVELVLALHYVFDMPKDKIIFDGGYQAYSHKLITGRKEYFHTLKIWNGLGGFLRREESEYDIIGAGHVGTSVSSALGIAEANKKLGRNGKIVAVIGDGAMTCGMAYEAMNHAGDMRSDLIVILNDNGMSISPNRGAIASYFSKIMAEPIFFRARESIKKFIREVLSQKGEDLIRIIRRGEASLISLMTPGIFFEALGFYYFGPVDGHNLKELIWILKKVKEWKGPVLVHVKTKKGKGYKPAEDDPEVFHRIPPFDKHTGKVLKKASRPSFSSVFGDFIVELAKRDKRVVGITAAMPLGTALDKLQANLPDRFYDVAIAEQHAVTFGAGLALAGMRPFVAIYSTFLQRAYDQILHDVAIQNAPVILCIDRAGIVGEDGATHHGVFDIAYLRPIPNMVLMSPADENDMRDMLLTALELGKPCAIRYPRSEVPDVPKTEPKIIEIGKAEVKKDGSDVVILAYGSLVYEALRAAEEAEKKYGCSVAVINSKFAKPLDTELICQYAQRTKRVITLEEARKDGGFGSAVIELLADKKIKADIIRMGTPDFFIDQGSRAELLSLIGLDKEGIKRSIERIISYG
ncbi:MAG: 1-deoxy-D-xylulose-5-phosphate synthase [Candidatus Calescibacterium sp.]|nr:1-deoxy-D-xylulose-5-phosphate synthase [Candidatus Calescibacterium sp.]MDW8087405.1 1-deoxy-D-xylulose-5-phosphate synthase [Candidatus Calescibacterium sp.]